MHQLVHSTTNWRAFAYFLAAVIPAKLAVLYLVGPSIWPDTGGYTAFAEAILDQGKAFRPIDWIGGGATPPFVFRLAGYPLVLAGAEFLSAENYASITVIFQIFLNALSVVLVFRYCSFRIFSWPDNCCLDPLRILGLLAFRQLDPERQHLQLVVQYRGVLVDRARGRLLASDAPRYPRARVSLGFLDLDAR